MSDGTEAAIVVAYPITIQALAKEIDGLRGISFRTQPVEAAKAVRVCVDWRVRIEARRKELKARSLEYGRNVDAVASELTKVVEAVELPMQVEKKEVAAEKQAAKEAAARAEREAIEAEILERRKEKDAELAAERKAEEKVLAARKAELEAMKAEIAKEREEMSRVMAEAAAGKKELLRLQQEAEARKLAEENEKRAAWLAERKIAEQKEAELRRQEFEASEAKRRAALLPAKGQLVQYARALRAVFEQSPEDLDDVAQAVSDAASNKVGEAIDMLEGWQP